MTTIGWLGTGRMGIEMATRLIDDGTAMTVWNRTPSKAEPLTKLGAAQADHIGDLGQCDVVFTTVTSSEDLIEVTLGSDGLFHAQTPPRIVVDCSTVSAEAATENLRKDFDLGLAAARELEVPMPVGALTHQLLQTAVGLGYGKSDYVSLYQVAASAAALPKS